MQGASGEFIYTASFLRRLAFHQHMAQPFKTNICLSLIYACVGRALSMHIYSSAVPNETFLPWCRGDQEEPSDPRAARRVQALPGQLPSPNTNPYPI